MAIRDQFQNIGATIGRRYGGIRQSVVMGATSLTSFSPFIPKHLTIALQDLHSRDEAMASEFYNGRYLLAGKLVEVGSGNPFEMTDAPQNWQRALHEFGWLRHLSADKTVIANGHAKALVTKWIETESRLGQNLVWDTEITAKRLIFWLNHSVALLAVPDHDFHRAFMRALGNHVRFLKRASSGASAGLPDLLARIALCHAAVCFDGHGRSLDSAFEKLGDALDEQVPAGGCHISRNPETVTELLSFLLPLREGCYAAAVEIPGVIPAAIERLLFALRFLRMGDGNLARFNGTGVGEPDVLTTLSRYDDWPSDREINGHLNGYERLDAGGCIVLADVGAIPKGALSRRAHAGCLSFEFSSHTDCIIVNCGRPENHSADSPEYWRSTAAHSTAVFSSTSSAKFENSGAASNLLDGQIFGNQLKPVYDTTQTVDAISITASHLGYVREFGARHQRVLTLQKDGTKLSGSDWFCGPDKSELLYTTKDAVTVHFHLHPAIDAIQLDGTRQVVLQTRSGEKWVFSCNETKPVLEDSVFFASHSGAEKSKQIALHFNACKTAEVNWTLEKQ